MTTLWRIFLYSWRNLFRNAWIGAATVFVFTMALLSVNTLLGVNAMMGRVIKLLEEKVDVTVTFKPVTPEAVLSQARFYLTSLPQVSGVSVISAEDSLKAFRERHANNPKVLSALEELSSNPLGAQLVVKAKNTEDYPFLLQAVQNPQYASFIQSQTYEDHKTAIARVQDIGRNARLVGAVLVALFAVFGMLIAFNAIRVAIYTQREEIAIMRLVGASTAFIRAPFILEGLWLVVFSLGLTALIIASALTSLEPILRPLFDGTDPGLVSFFSQAWPQILLIEGGGLAFIVILVGWAAIGRYIHR